MKAKNKILTYEQARELQWFSKNCTGIRLEYYELLGQVTKFGEKVERLAKQGLLIENFLRANPGESFQDRVEELEKENGAVEFHTKTPEGFSGPIT